MENVMETKEFENLLKFNEENRNTRIAVAMSGGVDSSVTAYLLKKQGYDIFGITMKTIDAGIDEDARKVCEDLNIPHYVLDTREEFQKEVVDYFVEEYKNGRTPNPCVVCNKHIKLGRLIDFAVEKGGEYMATGHYTNIQDGLLCVGEDLSKDQVYFLSQAREENLKRLMFPLGKITKDKVRELGKYLGVRVHAKKDSQEICFVEDGKLAEFLIESSKGSVNKKGKFVDTKGKIIGEHKGFAFYTIGQRKGLGISAEKPYYVIRFNKERNEIILGSNEDLQADSLIGTDVNLYKYKNLKDLENQEFYAKTRSRDKFHLCKVEVRDENTIKVNFIGEKVRAITPGQIVALYDMDYKVIASGFIK